MKCLEKTQFLLEREFWDEFVLSCTSNILFLLSVSVTIKASVADDGYEQCEYAVKKWASSNSADSEVRDDKHALRDLLFFLHVPRTGGRTYFHW